MPERTRLFEELDPEGVRERAQRERLRQPGRIENRTRTVRPQTRGARAVDGALRRLLGRGAVTGLSRLTPLLGPASVGLALMPFAEPAGRAAANFVSGFDEDERNRELNRIATETAGLRRQRNLQLQEAGLAPLPELEEAPFEVRQSPESEGASLAPAVPTSRVFTTPDRADRRGVQFTTATGSGEISGLTEEQAARVQAGLSRSANVVSGADVLRTTALEGQRALIQRARELQEAGDLEGSRAAIESLQTGAPVRDILEQRNLENEALGSIDTRGLSLGQLADAVSRRNTARRLLGQQEQAASALREIQLREELIRSRPQAPPEFRFEAIAGDPLTQTSPQLFAVDPTTGTAFPASLDADDIEELRGLESDEARIAALRQLQFPEQRIRAILQSL